MELILLLILLTIMGAKLATEKGAKYDSDRRIAQKIASYDAFENKYGDPVFEKRIWDALFAADHAQSLLDEAYGVLSSLISWKGITAEAMNQLPKQLIADIIMINRGKLPRHQLSGWRGWVKGKKEITESELMRDHEIAQWMARRMRDFYPELKMLARYAGVAPDYVWEGSCGDFSGSSHHIGVYRDILTEATD